MSIGEFLSTRLREIAVLCLAVLSVCFVAYVCGMTVDMVVLVAVVLVFALCLSLVLGFFRVRRFYQDIQMLSEKLEQPYQMHSLVSRPQSPDLRITYNALRTMGMASAAEVAEANSRADDNRSYIETWVHEMKTPLAAAELVAQRAENPLRGQLVYELDSMERQVEQVLWYARSANPERDYTIRSIALMDVARRVCKENARFLIEKGVALRFPECCDVVVFSDEKQVAFIVSQAVVNAAKYGSSQIAFSVSETESDEGSKTVMLVISDNGKGIPAQDVPRVFDRGFTGVRGREVGSSTGMGLYLAAQLCSVLGLGLAIASEEGVGTQVTISFPLDRRRVDFAASGQDKGTGHSSYLRQDE